jgi:hypothetical protein
MHSDAPIGIARFVIPPDIVIDVPVDCSAPVLVQRVLLAALLAMAIRLAILWLRLFNGG